MLKNMTTRQNGFLMLEIIIASLILAIALVPLAGVFHKPLQVNALSARRTAAANLAQQAVEALKVNDASFWQAIDEPTELDFSEQAHSIKTKQIVNQTEYNLQGTLQPHSMLPDDIVVATVIVKYPESGKQKSLQYVTYFTKQQY